MYPEMMAGYLIGSSRTDRQSPINPPLRTVGASVAAGVILDGAVSGTYSFAGNGHGFINFGGQFGLGIEGSPATAVNIEINYQYTATSKPIIKF